MNLQSIILLAVIIIVTVVAVFAMIRRKKSGKSNCGCCTGDCSSCASRIMEEKLLNK